jgi:hypothetical protein
VTKIPVGGGTPTILASNQAGPADIAVDASNVYWLNEDSSTVMKVPIGGGTPVTLAYDPGHYLNSIGVDSSSVYWAWNTITSLGGVTKAALDGCSLDGGISDGSAHECTGTLLLDWEESIYHLAVDSSSIYFTTTYKLLKLPLDGGTPAVLAENQYPNGIALDAINVYLTNESGKITKVPLGGGTVTMLATGQHYPFGIATDGAYVYWASCDTNGVVAKVSISGGPVGRVSLPYLDYPQYPCSVAVDATSVYWTNQLHQEADEAHAQQDPHRHGEEQLDGERLTFHGAQVAQEFAGQRAHQSISSMGARRSCTSRRAIRPS